MYALTFFSHGMFFNFQSATGLIQWTPLLTMNSLTSVSRALVIVYKSQCHLFLFSVVKKLIIHFWLYTIDYTQLQTFKSKMTAVGYNSNSNRLTLRRLSVKISFADLNYIVIFGKLISLPIVQEIFHVILIFIYRCSWKLRAE